MAQKSHSKGRPNYLGEMCPPRPARHQAEFKTGPASMGEIHANEAVFSGIQKSCGMGSFFRPNFFPGGGPSPAPPKLAPPLPTKAGDLPVPRGLGF